MSIAFWLRNDWCGECCSGVRARSVSDGVASNPSLTLRALMFYHSLFLLRKMLLAIRQESREDRDVTPESMPAPALFHGRPMTKAARFRRPVGKRDQTSAAMNGVGLDLGPPEATAI